MQSKSCAKCHPQEVHKGGHRVAAPMSGRRRKAGVMISSTAWRAPFTWQDFDLLKCICDQLAAGLLICGLAQKLLQARNSMRFSHVRVCFVHDIWKNTGEHANLMLQTCPCILTTPEFRADALRGISKTSSA